MWWATLGVGDGFSSFTALPYTLASSSTGLRACAPRLHVTEGEAALRCDRSASLVLGAVGIEAGHLITAFDELSVTISYQISSGGTILMPLLHGMPFVSALFSGAAVPQITFNTILLAVGGVSEPGPVSSQPLSGFAGLAGELGDPDASVMFLRFINGEQWLLYLPREIEASWTRWSLRFSAPFEGWLRLALMPGGLNTYDGHVSEPDDRVCTLLKYADAVPVGGSVHYSLIEDDPSHAALMLHWASQSVMGRTEPQSILMLALPHHLELMGLASAAAQWQSDGSGTGSLAPDTPSDSVWLHRWYDTHRGGLYPIGGAKWTLLLPLNTASFGFGAGFANCEMKEEGETSHDSPRRV